MIKQSHIKPGIILALVVCTISIIMILCNRDSKHVAKIKSSHFENMKNKTVVELVEILSYGKAQWDQIELAGDVTMVVTASWTNQYGREIKFMLIESHDLKFVQIKDVFFDDVSQGLLKAAYFMDIFSGLNQGKRIEQLIKPIIKKEA